MPQATALARRGRCYFPLLLRGGAAEPVLYPSPGHTTTVRQPALPAGLYALQVRAGAATATRRLVME